MPFKCVKCSSILLWRIHTCGIPDKKTHVEVVKGGTWWGKVWMTGNKFDN